MLPFVAMLFLPLDNTSKVICSASRTTSSNPLGYEYDSDRDTQTQKFKMFATRTNCVVNNAFPVTCGSAASAVFAIPPLTSNYSLKIVAVTSNRRIVLQPTTDNTGMRMSPICTILAVVGVNIVSSRSARKCFTIYIRPTKGTTCYYYWIVN
jgi:hypothetical protein